MNRKRFMKCHLLRRCGAVLLAAALSLSVPGTGSAFADTTDNGDEIIEMTVSGDYEASIDEAGGYVYYAFTPEESGTYSFYTTGDYDTYAYIYDADWNELDSDDDSGSSYNAKITISLEAGNTYYIAFRFFSSDTTGSFSVYAKKVLAAVSVELVLSQELVLYEGLDSYEEYDDNDEAFEYYEIYELNFTSGDQIVLTLEDGSTVTYTSYGDVYFYDENDEYLYFSYSSDQFDEHWEVGNTYYFTYTLTDYGIDVQIPVTIEENLYTDATAEFVSEEGLTLYEYINSYPEYDDDGEEFEYYNYGYLNFSSSDQIVITLRNGSTITYTAGEYGDFYDEDGNYLWYDVSSDQYSEHWEVGNTYYFTYTLTEYGIDVQIPVTIEANPYADATAAFVSEEGLKLYEGIDSRTSYDNNFEEFEYYDFRNLSFSSSDQIVITLSDGSTITYTADEYGNFYDEDGNDLEFYVSSGQYSEHWEAGGRYYYTLTLYPSYLTVKIPVRIAAPDFTSALEIKTDTEYIAEIGEAGGFVMYSFSPSVTGTYTTYSTGDLDTYAAMFDAEGNLLSTNDEAGDSSNALITIDLDAGSTYYIIYSLFSTSDTGSFSVYVEMISSSESDDGGTTGDEDASDGSGTIGDEDTSDDEGMIGDEDTSGDEGTIGDEDTSDDEGTIGDEDTSDDEGTIGDEDTSGDDGTTGGGSTSDDDGSNGDVSEGEGSSDQQNSGQTGDGSTNLKTQKITVKKAQLKKTIHTKKLKKKAQTFKLKASTSGNGKITYKKVSGNKKIKVSKTGKVTVKKGLKKGKTYKVKVKITAAKTSSYKKASVTKTIKIKIK